MTDKQALARWQFRHDFLEDQLAEKYVLFYGISKNEAIGRIREQCEKALKKAGFNYPLTEEER